MCVALDIPSVRYVPLARDYKDLYHIELRKAKYIEFCETKYIEQACLYIDVIIRNAELGFEVFFVLLFLKMK